MIALLEPLFQGERRAYGESLSYAPRFPPDALPVSRLLADPTLLAQSVRRFADRLGTDDLRPAASAWSYSYLGALLPPLAAAATLLRHRFPADANDMAVSLDHHGGVARFHIRALGGAGADTVECYDALLRGHLTPLFAQLGRQSGLAQKTLWGNLARLLDRFLAEAAQSAVAHGEADIAAAVAQDRAALLDAPAWAGAVNPLHMRQGRAQGLSDDAASPGKPLLLHRQCCLYHLLPDQGYCGACPLDSGNARVKGTTPAA
ncbi:MULTISPECIES: siderophore-iron reductase FhuF [unclassified Janthinobacterium]|uniref:siderophore-iron reductase FhuF n=1 Tax=unclassified Janthinobacterium TaxID=2610881 RepID=UPI0003497F77|nr:MULTISPECIES: siderophore-iron reductase FhuF [unclassified Janthinobacterium]MEC5161368.1 ferric iron reductase protein FhuF [Janthinobacterium sp. CG_S6]